MSVMFYSILFDLNPYLAIVPLSFISVCVVCEFAILLDVYILLSPQKEEVHSSSYGNRCRYVAAHSLKRLNPCLSYSMPR